MRPTQNHPGSHFHSGHSPGALRQKGTELCEQAPRPSFPVTHLPAIPCTETSTSRSCLMRHRASMLSAAAMAQQHLQDS